MVFLRQLITDSGKSDDLSPRDKSKQPYREDLP